MASTLTVGQPVSEFADPLVGNDDDDIDEIKLSPEQQSFFPDRSESLAFLFRHLDLKMVAASSLRLEEHGF